VANNYLVKPDFPRITLVDCRDDLRDALLADGYSISVASTGFFEDRPASAPPLHEKDLLIIDLSPGWNPEQSDQLALRVSANHRGEVLTSFASAYSRGGLVVCLQEREPVLAGLIGLPSIPRSQVTERALSPDEHPRLTEQCKNTVPGLAALFESHRGELRTFRALSCSQDHISLLENDAGETKALFERIEAGGILYMPYVERKVGLVRRLLRDVFPDWSPDLFPARPSEWREADEYQMPAVLKAREEIRVAREGFAERLEELSAKERGARDAQSDFVKVLIAESHELRKAVFVALEALQFEELIDVDDVKRESGDNPEEDLQLKDGAYFAVVEVTSGKGNARENDFQDLLKYQHRRRQNPGRTDIDPVAVRGLLVMNQHTTLEPKRRPALYEGNENDYPATARDLGVTLLSTWDLFQILRLVDAGDLSTEQARSIIKEPGLVEAPIQGAAQDPAELKLAGA
jgi:hypothetical protein